MSQLEIFDSLMNYLGFEKVEERRDNFMKRGIDVSENNGTVNWQEVKAAGIDFAIIRLGWGRGHLDEKFYENVNGALDAGLDIGVYYYSYALSDKDAAAEAEFAAKILIDCGLTNERLAHGVWFDMEDADGYKKRHGALGRELITQMCMSFIAHMNRCGFDCGIYASLDWLENKIATRRLERFFDGVRYWCAQWSSRCDWPSAAIWQYTSKLDIGGHYFDGNILYEV